MTQPSLDASELTRKIKEELRVFNNFSAILEKAENDGYISVIVGSLSEIFKNELNFAVKGLLRRTPQA